MTDDERQEMLKELARLGLWSEDDAGDPTIDKGAADLLLSRLKGRLAPGVDFGIHGHTGGGDSGSRNVYIIGSQAMPLTAGSTFQEAVCSAALALKAFLDQHPECAKSEQ